MTRRRFFGLGDSYHFWGVIPGSFHLVCPAENVTFFWLGTDRLGRDKVLQQYQEAIGYEG